MSFTWPIAEIGPSYLGLLFGIQGYTWSYEDSFGDTMNEYHLSMNIGASLSFDPIQHPANRSLYSDYTESYDY